MKILAVCVLIFVTSLINAQSFVASADNNKIGENDRFELTFTFEGKNINGLKNFTPPSFKDFRVLSGPNQSTSMQIINGAASASFSLSYILMPNTTGVFTIGSASIQYEGNNYSTEPVRITVVKGSQKPADNQSAGISNQEISENLFIRAVIDKSKVYQGEQVTVTYKLYTRLNIAAQMSVDKLPQYQGFWAEEIETPRNIAFSTEVIDGKQFRVGILKRAALFPNQSGKLEVTPLELTVPIQIQKKKNPNNIWDDFFGDPFGRAEIIEFPAKSNTLRVDVLPLPEDNKPDSFRGAVGKYDFTASLDKSKTRTNEPVSLRFSLSGSGNIKLLEFPAFEIPNGFEKYDPKIDEQINRTARINGTKQAEFLLIPRAAGSREIPPVEFSYFDPESRAYRTIKSGAFKITIDQGETDASDLASRQFTGQLEGDIRYIKTSHDDIEQRSGLLLNEPGFWIASIIPLAGALLLIGWKRKQDRLSGNQQLLRYSRAEKVARNRFKKARKLMEQQQVEQFYSEISQALFGYLEDKFHILKSEFTLERAEYEMAKRNISGEIISKMKTNAQRCEFIRFAPSTNPSQAMNEMYSALSEVVVDIERSFSR